MKKYLLLLCLFLFIGQLYPSESSLNGMSAISDNGNSFVPDFWVDTLTVNPAYAVYLNSFFGFILNNRFDVIHKHTREEDYKKNTQINTYDFHLKDNLYPMFLFNFGRLTFGLGGNFLLGGNYERKPENSTPFYWEQTSTLGWLGAEILLGFDLTDNFKFGLDTKFNGDVTAKNLDSSIIPGILILTEKQKISFSLPMTYSYTETSNRSGSMKTITETASEPGMEVSREVVKTTPIPNKFNVDLIFMDDIAITNNFSIRVPVKANFAISYDADQFRMSVPLSGGVSFIGTPVESLLAFIGTEIKIDPNSENIGKKNSNDFKFAFTPTLSAGIEGKLLPWFILRAGMKMDLINYDFEYKEETKTRKESYVHNVNFIKKIDFTTGMTFRIRDAYQIDVAANLNNIEAAFYFNEIKETSKRSGNMFNATLTVAVSRFLGEYRVNSRNSSL